MLPENELSIVIVYCMLMMAVTSPLFLENNSSILVFYFFYVDFDYILKFKNSGWDKLLKTQ